MLTQRDIRKVVDAASRSTGLIAYTLDWRGPYYSGTTRRVFLASTPVDASTREVMRRIRNERADRRAIGVTERESIEVTENWD